MVRIDGPVGKLDGGAISRFVVGYNDDTSSTVDLGPDAGCWMFTGGATDDGWVISESFGGDWTRQPQLPVTPGLQAQGVNARHGDPWVAAFSSQDPTVPGVALYVSVAQQGLARYGPPWFVLMQRSLDYGKTFPEATVVVGPQAAVPDGPKVAITGDGQMGVVIWNDLNTGGLPYRAVTGLTATNVTLASPGVIIPTQVAKPPGTSCTFAGAVAHPRVAMGLHTIYIAAITGYQCNQGFIDRVEVYRSTEAGIGNNAFERILSVAPAAGIGAAGFGQLNAQDASGNPRFGTMADRGSSLPSLAVGQDASGEFVVVADLTVRAGTQANEGNVERVVQWRLGLADSCNAKNHQADLDSCGSTLVPQEIDAISTVTKMDTVGNRAGIWESKPAVFTGRVPDGTVDPRVGIVWYSQPYKGLLNVTDEMRTRTIVEAVYSTDGGLTYQGPFNLTELRSGDPAPSPADSNIGFYFYPCQLLCTGYYGEYLSGAFQFRDPTLYWVVAAWGDSREGCIDQSTTTQHQHVWAGAVRGR
jgi:hypothetical protein